MTVLYELEGPVAVVTINRPEARNAIDRPTANGLAEAFRRFDADADAAVAVLTGAGGHFCAGADLKALAREPGANAPPKVTLEGDGPLGCTRMLLSKPVIAAIGGFCVAGGFELALWADLRIVEEDATMGCYERRWGVPLVDGGTYRLPRIVGVGRALDIMMTGRAVRPQEALAIGLATEVVPRGEGRARAVWLGRELAAFPQVCLREDRLSLYEGLGLGLEQGLRRETERGLRTIAADEPRSGATRFAAGAGRHGQPERRP